MCNLHVDNRRTRQRDRSVLLLPPASRLFARPPDCALLLWLCLSAEREGGAVGGGIWLEFMKEPKVSPDRLGSFGCCAFIKLQLLSWVSSGSLERESNTTVCLLPHVFTHIYFLSWDYLIFGSYYDNMFYQTAASIKCCNQTLPKWNSFSRFYKSSSGQKLEWWMSLGMYTSQA